VVGKPLSRADGGLVVRIYAPGAGALVVRGLGAKRPIRPARASTGKAGTLMITVRPSRAGKALLRSKGRVKAKAAFVFTPVGGAPQKSTRVLTLKRASGR